MNALFSPIDRAVDIRTLVRALLVLAPPFAAALGTGDGAVICGRPRPRKSENGLIC
jgi:hypothetical protein